MAVARYTLAVNRRYKRDGEQEADLSHVSHLERVRNLYRNMEAPDGEIPFD